MSQDRGKAERVGELAAKSVVQLLFAMGKSFTVDGLSEKLREFFRQQVRPELRAVAALNNMELIYRAHFLQPATRPCRPSVADSQRGGSLLTTEVHNKDIAIRKMGVERKLKINEYGVFEGRGPEAEVYAQVGLRYIEPELREDPGEIQAAQHNQLPKLVTLDQIRGDLHCHTTGSDGRNTLAEMAEAAQARGYEYLAICDHSKRVAMAHGLDAKRLAQQIKQIDGLNAKLRDITLLKSCEVDILEDGSLDLPDDILKELDLTVCSVHYKLNLPPDQQTERILRAMDNPLFRMLGHPIGRLINQRQTCDIDMARIMRAADERACFL
jgi:DNA polymerase (family 10)